MASNRRVPRPARKILAAFLLALVIGTVLLMLPTSTVKVGGLPLLPALFTATSALCVTGLADVDTATYWTSMGHVVILALIQIGGLGVMSFATLLGFSVTKKMSLSRRVTTASEAHSSFSNVALILGNVVRTTFLIEGVVALALTARFLQLGHTLGDSLWYGLFHAVSSFNNAGFALFSDSMMQFVDDWFICIPLMGATILGGLGFPVVFEFVRHYRLPRKWSMHTRLVLFGTAVLLLGSTLFVTAGEWRNQATLGPLPVHAKILAGAFQAVQTRTAGFNSVDIGGLHHTTLFGMDMLMFIGGGPAGTAGGIKVTTVLVLFFIAWSEIRGEEAVNIFGKRLPPSVHRQVITVTLLASSLVAIATLLLLALTPYSLNEILFEVISAFGTVGLSTGITPSLDTASQLILIALMIIGRLGPITVATALAVAPTRQRAYELPKERPIIG